MKKAIFSALVFLISVSSAISSNPSFEELKTNCITFAEKNKNDKYPFLVMRDGEYTVYKCFTNHLLINSDLTAQFFFNNPQLVRLANSNYKMLPDGSVFCVYTNSYEMTGYGCEVRVPRNGGGIC